MSLSSAARVTTRPTVRPTTRPSRQPAPPRLRVVSVPRRTRSRAGTVVCCGLILVTGLVALLLLNITLSRGSYELFRLEAEQVQLAERQQALREQLDAEAAPQRLARRARELGMVPAKGPAFVRLSDGDVLGVAGRASTSKGSSVGR